jgi:hypothetical protein
VIEFAAARGASLRLVSDDRQLAAVGAGGVLRDIDRTYGAVTLSEVRRFTRADASTNHAEAATSLAIRRDDPAGLGYYLDHGRIHVSDESDGVRESAWQAGCAVVAKDVANSIDGYCDRVGVELGRADACVLPGLAPGWWTPRK